MNGVREGVYFLFDGVNVPSQLSVWILEDRKVINESAIMWDVLFVNQYLQIKRRCERCERIYCVNNNNNNSYVELEVCAAGK